MTDNTMNDEVMSNNTSDEEAAVAGIFDARKEKRFTWSNVTMTVKSKGQKKASPKKILDKVWGSAGNEITAILGPSGAGKTSLLNLLAGRRYGSKNMHVTYNIELDGKEVSPESDMSVRKQIAFVEQHDTLHVAATPRESIRFSARLRLPASTTAKELDALTNSMLEELGLEDCADTVIGGELFKGISGGERKRASIGVELVTKPSIVFLDEPTSGLDSFSALKVIQVLKTVADTGASILLTIHQPASDIVDQLDRLILLRAGRVMYQGSEDDVTEYFASRNYPLPPKYNPADWIMIVAQTVPEKELEELGYFTTGPTNENYEVVGTEDVLSQEEESESKRNGSSVKSNGRQTENKHVSAGTEILWLVIRDFKSLGRNKMILGARIMLTTFMSVLIGLIFWRVGSKEPSSQVVIQSQFGALVMTLMMAMFGSALPTLIVFPEERPVFVREYSTNHYSVFAYFCSRLTLEAFLTGVQMTLLSFLTKMMIGFQQRYYWLFAISYTLAMSSTAISMVIGSSVDDPKLAIEFLPMTLVPQIMFAGFFVAPELIPIWLRWLQYVMPLTYAVKLGVNQEFNRDCGSNQMNAYCNSVMAIADVNPDDTWWYWLALVGIFVVLRLAALVFLKWKANM